MKTIRLSTLAVLFLVMVFASCKKREAKRELIGNWTVTGYTGVLVNDCSGDGESFDIDGEIFGAVTFHRSKMRRDYDLVNDTADCYVFGDADDLVKWKVIDYSEQLFIAHQYTLDIDGLSWNLFFGDEAVGEEPVDQEVIYLSHLSNEGDAISIELTRDPE